MTITTTSKRARTSTPVPLPDLPPAAWFQRGYHAGAQAADQETRWRTAPRRAEEVFAFIQTRLDPAHIQRQRDAARNPLPPAYHAGFVAGYLMLLYAPAPDGNQQSQPERRVRA